MSRSFKPNFRIWGVSENARSMNRRARRHANQALAMGKDPDTKRGSVNARHRHQAKWERW